MKKNIRILIISLALLFVIVFSAFSVFAEDTPIGSDLPVSESYVLRALNALEERLNKKIDTMAESLGSATPGNPAETVPAVSAEYTVVYLKKGQTIAGACELILRSGSAKAYCPGANGLSDLTDGADLANGASISQNHLLLVPRDDGRGLTVTSADAYLMVRGTYVITDAQTDSGLSS